MFYGRVSYILLNRSMIIERSTKEGSNHPLPGLKGIDVYQPPNTDFAYESHLTLPEMSDY